MKESHIEKKVCAYAKFKGFLIYKFSSPSNRGVPDRIFIKNSNVFFIEFKAVGKLPTKLQFKTIYNIEEAGVTVYIVDNFEKGKKIIDKSLL